MVNYYPIIKTDTFIELILSLANFFNAFISAYFLIGMHIILATPGGTGLYLSYNIIAWLIVVVLIALGLWQITVNQKIYYSKFLLGLTLGCICLVVPVFYSFEFTDHAIPRLLALVSGLLLLCSLYQFNFSTRKQTQLLWLIIIAVAIEAGLGLAQFFIFVDGFWGGYKVGISRPHGVFLQPNVMASFMATGIAIALFLSPKLTQQKKHVIALLARGQKILLYFVLFTSSFLLVVLQSRTGYIGAIIAIVLIAPYLYQKAPKQLAINLLIISLGVATSLACFDSSDIPKREHSIYQSPGVRTVIFEVSVDMVMTKPLLGVGYGHFERGFIDHFNQYALSNPEVGNTIERLSHPHNEVLYWLVEGGLLPLLAFIVFTLAYLYIWLKIPIRKALALLGLLLPILLHSQLELPFYSSASHFIIFLLLLWLTDNYAQRAEQQAFFAITIQKTFLLRFLALLIPLIFIPFLLTSLHTAHILVEHEKNQEQTLDRLTSIINPIAWQDRLDSTVYAHILVVGIANNDKAQLERYVNWGLKRIKYKPRVSLYRNTLLALRVLGYRERYQALLIQAKSTYPQQEAWHKGEAL